MEPLPPSGPEREVLLRALREYSEYCEPPRLTSDCPFSVDIDPNMRGCGEECMDILGRYHAPPPSGEVEITDQISVRRVRRPRARRGPIPSAPARPFDAKEVYLRDASTTDLARWSLPGLLYRLKEVLASPPPKDESELGERETEVKRLIALVEARGVPFDDEVRRYTARHTAAALIALAIPHRAQPTETELPPAWAAIAAERLGIADTESDAKVGARFVEFIRFVYDWSEQASLDALVRWSAPTSDVESASLTVASERANESQWVMDRFLLTYLHDWDTASLHLEWKYVHGQYAAPCAPSEMTSRVVDEGTLARTIADRAIADGPRDPSLAASRLVRPAVRFLEEGRRASAAALFEAAVEIQPEDPDANNNLGFCLLPDRPEDALASLDAAEALGPTDPLINAANRVVCLARLGHVTSAIDLAEAVLSDRPDETGPSFAWLWSLPEVIRGAEPTLIEVDDIYAYVIDAACVIAEVTGDPTLLARWGPRDT